MSNRMIKVKDITYITPLQMDGPIVFPIAVAEKTVRELIRRGYTVIENVDGTDVRLSLSNWENPKAYLEAVKAKEAAEKKAASEEHTRQVVHERKFTKNAPIKPAPVTKPEPKPEKPVVKTVIEQAYEFGNDVEVIDTVIEPEPEMTGRLFTGRPMPDISENIEPVAEVDISTDGHVEDTKTVENNQNNNRLQKKRKHKR